MSFCFWNFLIFISSLHWIRNIISCLEAIHNNYIIITNIENVENVEIQQSMETYLPTIALIPSQPGLT